MKNINYPGIQAAICCAVLLVSASRAADSTVNFDTAWTYVYDGGKDIGGILLIDAFYDLKVLPNGVSICVGLSGDTTNSEQTILVKLDNNGKVIQKKLFTTNNAVHSYYNGQHARSIALAKNGDIILGGTRWTAPLIFRLDSLCNLKWSTWYYDSTKGVSGRLLQGNATINCVRETKRGTFICAGGDYFTDQNYRFGTTTYDYFAILSIDSMGKIIDWGQGGGVAGYSAGAFDIEETEAENLILAGNQEIFYFDSAINLIWKKKYTFMLDGVGSEVNNITRCKKVRDGRFIVAGQTYEGNCWTNFKQLYYDAWWSPISLLDGTNTTWDTAGYQGGNDQIYDFTQLNNGNLIFVGSRYSGPGGIWTFVTDSSGKNVLWEKQTPVPYKADLGTSARAYSVCATADGGFTVAGELLLADELGGHNAMAAHFVPKPLAGVVAARQIKIPFSQLSARIVGKRLVVSSAIPKTNTVVSLFGVSGKRIAMQKGQNEISLDISNMARGVYFVKIESGKSIWTTKVQIER